LIDCVTLTLSELSTHCSIYFPHRLLAPAIALLASRTPGQFQKRVALGLSGSDSIECAIKAVRKYRKTELILSFKGSFHGTGFLPQSVTHLIGSGTTDPNVRFVDFPDSISHCTETLKSISALLEADRFAGIILEPIQGDAGNIVPHPDFLSRLSRLAQHYGVPIIADEIQCGVARTGYLWASEAFGLIPDLLVAGKGLAGGYFPVSACIGREEILAALGPAEHAFTLAGHPVGCALMLHVFREIDKLDLLNEVRRKEILLRKWYLKLRTDFEGQLQFELHGRGLHFGLIVRTHDGMSIATDIASHCLESGVLLGLLGLKNEVLRIHPPLIISDSDFTRGLNAIARACAALVSPPSKRTHGQQNRIIRNGGFAHA